MNSLKELKSRLCKGAILKLIHTTGPTVSNLGMDRVISESNTVGIQIEMPPVNGVGQRSYLDWPKAKEVMFFADNDDRFRIDRFGVTLVYDIVRKEAA